MVLVLGLRFMQECTLPVNQWTPPLVTACNSQHTSPEIRSALDQLARQHALDPAGVTASSATSGAAQAMWQLTQLDVDAPDTPIGTLGLIRDDGVKLAIDFTRGKARHRVNESDRGAQPLKKALGAKAEFHIIDATGGLGQDAWAIASLGCQVSVFEAHPIVHALLSNALLRAGLHNQFKSIASRINLVHADASGALEQCAPDVQAIYLDPMYPERRKSSQTRKGMQFLHALLGPPDQQKTAQLFDAALNSGVKRVVVKRPKGAPAVQGIKPWKGQQTSTHTPNTRFDIYHRST